jgi:hypothetical protein
VSLTPVQRGLILHLHHGEGVSIQRIAALMELSVSAVAKVVREGHRQDALEAHPMRPCSKTRLEREIWIARRQLMSPRAPDPPPRRRARRERRHDRA